MGSSGWGGYGAEEYDRAWDFKYGSKIMTAPERVELDTAELRLEARKRMREIDGALLRNAADEIDALRLSLRSAEEELSVLRAEDARHIERETSYSHREEALRALNAKQQKLLEDTILVYGQECAATGYQKAEIAELKRQLKERDELLKEWLLVAGWTNKPGRLIERTEATLGENRIAPGA